MARVLARLEVDLGARSYPITIGQGLVSHAPALCERLRSNQVMIVSNEVVAPLYLESLRQALADHRVAEVVLPDGESFKTLDTLQRIYTALLEQRFDRGCTLLALGGGVVGDMTGFAAATYQRGVDFIQVPTTLLSQVDSSVGGKTGVNHPLGKNMIGAFHQPRAVVIDIDTLATLPPRELSAGLAEVIKYGVIDDPAFFSWLEAQMPALRRLDPDALAHAIERSCADKAAIVAADEREAGRRALLNLGHTFGHAIETAMGYGNWLHGEAVGAGMCMAARLSHRLGWMASEEVRRVERLVAAAGLPTEPPAIPADRFLSYMAVDKKVQDGRLRLVLLRGIGRAEVTADFDHQALRELLDQAATPSDASTSA